MLIVLRFVGAVDAAVGFLLSPCPWPVEALQYSITHSICNTFTTACSALDNTAFCLQAMNIRFYWLAKTNVGLLLSVYMDVCSRRLASFITCQRTESGRYEVATTWMCDCLQTGEPTRHITNHQSQLNLLSLRDR